MRAESHLFLRSFSLSLPPPPPFFRAQNGPGHGTGLRPPRGGLLVGRRQNRTALLGQAHAQRHEHRRRRQGRAGGGRPRPRRDQHHQLDLRGGPRHAEAAAVRRGGDDARGVLGSRGEACGPRKSRGARGDDPGGKGRKVRPLRDRRRRDGGGRG